MGESRGRLGTRRRMSQASRAEICGHFPDLRKEERNKERRMEEAAGNSGILNGKKTYRVEN